VLAPVLARLDGIPGVSRSRVDSSGQFFWLTLDEDADAPRVVAVALEVLGRGARALPADQAGAQLAAHPRGDPWLGAGEVLTLSFLESRILSVRIAGELERRTGSSPEQREQVADAIRMELFAAMERIHAEGGRRSGGWIYAEWPAIASAALGRCDASLPEDLRRRMAEILPALLAR
jgi:hypothetical protein